MAARDVFSEEELAQLRGFPEVNRTDLIRHFTLTGDDEASNGAYLDGTLKSTYGNSVYYSGLVVINNCSDYDDGRYTGNVTSKTGQGAGGDVTAPPPIVWPCSLDGEKARVCRDIDNQPDPCGSWSALIPD